MNSVFNLQSTETKDSSKSANSLNPINAEGEKAETKGEFSNLFESVKKLTKGQILSASLKNIDQKVEGLSSEILGPAVKILTVSKNTISNESLYEFAKSQGLDDEAIKLILYNDPNLEIDLDIDYKVDLNIDFSNFSKTNTNDEKDDSINLKAKNIENFSNLEETSEEFLQNIEIFKKEIKNKPLFNLKNDERIEKNLNSEGIYVDKKITDSDQFQHLIKTKLNINPLEKTVDISELKNKQVLEVREQLNLGVKSIEIPFKVEKEIEKNIAIKLSFSNSELSSYLKKLDSKKILETFDHKLSFLTETPKSLVKFQEQLKFLSSPITETLVLGSELTGEDLNLILSNRNTNSENKINLHTQTQTLTHNQELESKTQEYEKLTQRMGEALGQRLAAQIAKGQWKIEIALKPSDLGNVDIKLDMKDGGLQASFNASQAMTRELILDSLPRLKEALLKSGMEVASMNVNVRQDNQNGGKSTPKRNQQTNALESVSEKDNDNFDSNISTNVNLRSQNLDDGLDILV